MIQTKTEQEREDVIRARLEEITKQLVVLQDKIDRHPFKHPTHEKMKIWCGEKQMLLNEKNRLINLLNTKA